MLLVVFALVAGRCSRGDRPDAPATPPAGSAPSDADGASRAAATTPPADAAGAAAQARRTQEIVAAIDAVHAYLQAVGARDFEKTDALWQPDRHPTTFDEAGLRELGPLRALRIHNFSPELPPGNDVPAALEVPVQLVANPERGGAVRLRGHYRVRREPVRARWEIAGASLQPASR